MTYLVCRVKARQTVFFGEERESIKYVLQTGGIYGIMGICPIAEGVI